MDSQVVKPRDVFFSKYNLRMIFIKNQPVSPYQYLNTIFIEFLYLFASWCNKYQNL